jgi:hypothetical protein
VLVCSERRVLLAGCWWLICSERKVLLPDKPSEHDGLTMSDVLVDSQFQTRGGFGPRATRAMALGVAQILPYNHMNF